MPSFKYVAKDSSGKTLSGAIEADNQAGVVEALRKKDLIIISVVQERGKLSSGVLRRKIKQDDVVIFSRQLATMVDAGIPLVSALDVLCEQLESRAFADMLAKVRSDIETGASLSIALGKYTNVFDPLYVSMIKAGETSGMLDEILDRLATYLEKSSALNRKVKSSLIYPALVVTMAFLITGFLIVKVIPTFKGIFELLGGTLPLPTRILIAISDVIRHYLLLAAAASVISVVLIARYIKTGSGRLRFDRLRLKFPVLGELFQKISIAKFSRTLATLVKSGVPILGSLEIVGKTAGNKVIEMAVEDVRKSVREGEPIADPLSKSGVFPPMVVRMIGVGEKTGELEKMLSKIADFYEEQVDAAVSGLTSLIEPLIIAFLGVVIGGIVVAMFLPILKLTEIIGR